MFEKHVVKKQYAKLIKIAINEGAMQLDQNLYLEDYFQKGALMGQRASLSLWYVDTKTREFCSRVFEGLSRLAYNFFKFPKLKFLETSLFRFFFFFFLSFQN